MEGAIRTPRVDTGPPIEWRSIRLAIDLTQRQMAELCCCSRSAIVKYENKQIGAPPAVVIFLRSALRYAKYAKMLKLANVPHPFPEDLKRLP